MKFVIFTVLSLVVAEAFAQGIITGNRDEFILSGSALKQNRQSTFARLFNEITRKIAIASSPIVEADEAKMQRLRTLHLDMRAEAKKLSNLDPTTVEGQQGLVQMKLKLLDFESRLSRE